MKIELSPEAFGALAGILEQTREDFKPSQHALDFPNGVTAKLEAKFMQYLDVIDQAMERARQS